MKIGVYPGTFDPITTGHLDIIKRASSLFDRLWIVIPDNPAKKTLFTLDERLEMIKEALIEGELDNCQVASTNLLTVDFASSIAATAIVRGLRMVSDFEYELQLSTINKCLKPQMETIFIMSSHEYSFLSSSIVKEIAHFEGNFDEFVPKVVAKKLKEKINQK